jgi:hypothetical protein
MTKAVKCSSCEHVHTLISTCEVRTVGTGSGFSVPCGCTAGAAQVITVQRATLYPVPGFGGRAKTSYTYTIDGGPLCQYGPGLSSLRSVLKRHYRGATIIESWRA